MSNSAGLRENLRSRPMSDAVKLYASIDPLSSCTLFASTIDRKLPDSEDAVGAMGLYTPNTCIQRNPRSYAHAVARLQTVHQIVAQRHVDRPGQLHLNTEKRGNLDVKREKRGNLAEGSALGHFLDGDGLEIDVFGVAEFKLERLFCA